MKKTIKIHLRRNNIGRQHKSRAMFIALVLAVAVLHNSPLRAASENSIATRIITDMAGRSVEIPARPHRIVCLDGPAYEKIFALGAADRVVLVPNVMLPWDYELNPDLKNIETLSNFTSPDVEKLLDLGTDLVFFKPFDMQIRRLTAAGIPVVVAYDGSRRPKTMEEFIQDIYSQIRFYGAVLGGDADKTAEAYCSYMDEKIRKVLAVTQNIPDTDRPRVFCYSGATNSPGGTQSKYTTAYWLVEAAGGKMMTVEDSAYFVSVSTEQMILWDPEFIIASTGPSIDSILNNPQFKGMTAIINKRVLPCPQGLFYWTHFSTESFILVQYLAKHFYPDLFTDLNVEKELKDYYEKFYHYPLTTAEAALILNRLPPR